MKPLFLALLLALFAAPVHAAGEAAKTNLEILRDTIRVNKKALVAANLDTGASVVFGAISMAWSGLVAARA